MGYIIEYDKVFLRSTSGYTPLLLLGDSDGYVVNGRRERGDREWSVFQNLLGVSESQMLESIQPMLDDPNRQYWVRRGKWIDAKGLVSWVKNGCKRAVTIEELLHANARHSVLCWVTTTNSHVLLDACVSLTPELDAWIAQAKKVMAEDENAYPEILLSNSEPVRHPSKAKSPQDLVVIKYNGCFDKGYVGECTADSIKFSQDRSRARIFTREEAQAVAPLFPGCRIVSASVLDSPCNMGVEITDELGERYYLTGLPGSYQVRLTTQARDAKRYSTRAAAERAAKTAKHRNPDWDYTVVELPPADRPACP